ncbi:MAG TPA: hypothetical protein VEJ18_06925 [Planctomycetota bacterium]|nr:hypothetical protein [Planctomycetota bacterium]
MRRLPLFVIVGLLSCTPKPPDFTADLLRAASEYVSYGRVDDERRLAPELCRPAVVARGRVSDATPSSPHGRKFYYLFARDARAYRRGGEQPAGQVLVKESWIPEAAPDVAVPTPWTEDSGRADPALRPLVSEGQSFIPRAERQGRTWRPAGKSDLFLMLKLDAERPGTDRGWVYGTVSADGRTVTSAGKLGSCMDCHVEAQPDRLFGIAP